MNRPAEPIECVPLFQCLDLRASVTHYRELGFVVSWDPGGEFAPGYAFARYGHAAFHISENPNLDIHQNALKGFLVTTDPDSLYERWSTVGSGETYAPWNAFNGYYGTHLDADYNTIFFGLPTVWPGDEHNGRPT